MRTRCPVCSTVFRVTSEQLRLRAGKVRCGHCDSVFNAFEALLEDEALAAVPAPVAPALFEPPPQPAVEITPETSPGWEMSPPSPPAFVVEALAEQAAEIEPALAPEEPFEPMLEAGLEIVPEPQPGSTFTDEVEAAPQPVGDVPAPLDPVDVEVETVSLPVERFETTEESTSAAREAGLVAARELSDTPAYNRWAAGALAGNGLGDFSSEAERPAVWPFVLFSLVLGIALLAQLLFYFRTDLVRRVPDMAALYALAAVDVPLPQNSDLVAIESSDLQSDNARGLFVLQATLRNRAAYAQAWPVLELTLTDTHDMVVARRVLSATEYLRPDISQVSFPANGELAIRLWVEAKDIGAAGYRLYVFYP